MYLDGKLIDCASDRIKSLLRRALNLKSTAPPNGNTGASTELVLERYLDVYTLGSMEREHQVIRTPLEMPTFGHSLCSPTT
jgi:hypothetical protein